MVKLMDKMPVDIIRVLEENNIQIKPEGYSMYPLFIPGRDWAVIGNAQGRKLKRGDVVLYRRQEGILVLHRIWRVKEDGYYMVGDNQTEIEGPLERQQIKGIMLGAVRNGREFSVQNPVYRLCAGIWLRLRPVRRPVSLAVAKIKRILKKNNGSR